ncbi:MAG: hypothetical protein B7W98_01215 [Parcubacteria group bacterium 20-58-5]|nr:MAG: hypothetical protein B7W98_01215 [Parcubacteria group bacterium 20-58-5]
MEAQNRNIPGVGIIIVHKGTFLLQLRDDNPNILNPSKWGFVGGGIDEGEQPEEAIRRECTEEIGIVPKNLNYIGYTNDSKFRFYAYLDEQEAENLSLGEGQEIRFFAPENIPVSNATPRVLFFFGEQTEVVQKLVGGQEVTAEDLGLER